MHKTRWFTELLVLEVELISIQIFFFVYVRSWMSGAASTRAWHGDYVWSWIWRFGYILMSARLQCGRLAESIVSQWSLDWCWTNVHAEQYVSHTIVEHFLRGGAVGNIHFLWLSVLVFCKTPPVIEHARHSALPEQLTFELDSTVQYHCHTGYVTAGFPRAKCLAIDGQASWYGPDIQCEPRSCGQPPDPSHGWHAGECYTFGCRITYHCSEGYELVGKSERFCQATGDWAPKEQTCVRKYYHLNT